MTEQEVAIIEKFRTELVEHLQENSGEWTDNVYVEGGCTTCGGDFYDTFQWSRLEHEIDKFCDKMKGKQK